MYPGVYVKNFAYSTPQNGIYGSEVRKSPTNKKGKLSSIVLL